MGAKTKKLGSWDKCFISLLFLNIATNNVNILPFLPLQLFVCLFCYAVIRRTTKTWLDILTRLYLNVCFKYLQQLCIKFWNKESFNFFHLER